MDERILRFSKIGMRCFMSLAPHHGLLALLRKKSLQRCKADIEQAVLVFPEVQLLSFDEAVDLARAAAHSQRRVIGRDHARALATRRAPGCPIALGPDRDGFTELQTEFGLSLLHNAVSCTTALAATRSKMTRSKIGRRRTFR